MTTFNRWLLVALGVVLVVAVPAGVRSLPVGDSDVSAARLLALVEDSRDAPYSGFVVTQGTLSLPVTSRFTDVGSLFGETTRLRVWWRGDDAWRVDKLLTAGETDLFHEGDTTTSYDYEDAQATVSTDPDIRLPRSADLLPPDLAARVLDDVDAADVRRLPTRRVAGVAAPGLRLQPSAPQASVDHVDLWADPDTGVPLRLEVYGAGSGGPAFTTAFRDFSPREPSADVVAFDPTADTEVEFDDVLDIADAANQYAPLRPPTTVAGLAKGSASDGAVGVYGTGVTQLIAIPLRGREAGPLREQLRTTPGVVVGDAGTTVTAGPLGVLLSGRGDDGGWLLTGLVTPDTLTRAVGDLLRDTVYLEDDDR